MIVQPILYPVLRWKLPSEVALQGLRQKESGVVMPSFQLSLFGQGTPLQDWSPPPCSTRSHSLVTRLLPAQEGRCRHSAVSFPTQQSFINQTIQNLSPHMLHLRADSKGILFQGITCLPQHPYVHSLGKPEQKSLFSLGGIILWCNIYEANVWPPSHHHSEYTTPLCLSS